ncbi:MAG: DNA replication/repair protein RecF [Clostridia bacterium]|nr:DNA replication/repair protein RecF [Clostridia bacterium]
MYIKNIELSDFRNYESLNLEFDKNVNMILGQNAQGKTNLLESIFLTSLGKSFRTTKDSEMISFGKEYAKVAVNAVKEDEEVKIEIVLRKDGKIIKINDIKARKNSELLENVYVISFIPDDLKIVKDEPEKRRKFTDRELCQIKPAYYAALSDYKKTLFQRNNYLKEENINDDMLDVWDFKLSEYGAKLIFYRRAFIEKLSVISSILHKSITQEKEDLSLYYESNINSEGSMKQIQAAFYEELKQKRKHDKLQRTTSKGPHKDDIKIVINGIDIRHFGSQGQQRTAALSIKLSEIRLIEEETGEKAILILDDVLSELDSQRQKFLISSLSDVQLFISATELPGDVEESLNRGKKYIVSEGKIKQI